MVQVGDSLPAGTTFSYVPYDPSADSITSCGIPITLDASKEWANKKVVLFAVPGAFTPGCSARHLPGYIEKRGQLLAKGADVVAALAYNDAFVMNAWSKANGVKNDDILFLSDVDRNFSKQLGDEGWTIGDRLARYALIIDHGKITYAQKEETTKEVGVSGVDAVLAKL